MPVVTLLLFSVVYVVSYSLMLHSVFGFDYTTSLTFTAYLGLAWVVGVLSIVSPGGLGVREAVFIMMAHASGVAVTLELLSVIAVVSRLWLVAQEIVGVLIVLPWKTKE
jgi:uncharacterized membrane protein YbhN (UPF0104 family)